MHLPHSGDGRARSPLPYGVVMATAGASHLATQVGPHRWGSPLLVLAVAAAVLLPLRAACRVVPGRRVFFDRWSPGDCTVPLGIAVVAVGLASEAGPWRDGVAPVAVALAWLATVAVFARLAAAMRPRLRDVDGSWFLAPAALLGDALAVSAVGTALPLQQIARWAALIAAAIGIGSYLVVFALAGARLARHGLRGAPQAPWWISAGCGGLGAATAGRVADAGPVRIPAEGVESVVVGLWILACLALIPVVVASVAHLLRRRRPYGKPPWPPTFSTAVFALGTLEAARWCESSAVHQVGRVAGWATVALWCLTVVLLVRHGVHRSASAAGRPDRADG